MAYAAATLGTFVSRSRIAGRCLVENSVGPHMHWDFGSLVKVVPVGPDEDVRSEAKSQDFKDDRRFCNPQTTAVLHAHPTPRG